MKKFIFTTAIIVGIATTGAYALNGNIQHKFMQNQEMMNHMQMQVTTLSEAGNDAFGTIQEAIIKLKQC